MAPLTLAKQVMTGQLRQYVAEHGIDFLAPAPKNPLTAELILRMLSTPNGTTEGDFVVDWNDYFWISVRATFESMAELGVRKADVSNTTMRVRATEGRHTSGTLRWRIGGADTAAPTVAQLRAATDGDGVWFVFAALKNDPFGEHFGSKPAWLPYSVDAPRNACRSLVALELAAARAGLAPDRRSSTFLFGPSFGAHGTTP
jgi:hypothetical protein